MHDVFCIYCLYCLLIIDCLYCAYIDYCIDLYCVLIYIVFLIYIISHLLDILPRAEARVIACTTSEIGLELFKLVDDAARDSVIERLEGCLQRSLEFLYEAGRHGTDARCVTNIHANKG